MPFSDLHDNAEKRVRKEGFLTGYYLAKQEERIKRDNYTERGKVSSLRNTKKFYKELAKKFYEICIKQ